MSSNYIGQFPRCWTPEKLMLLSIDEMVTHNILAEFQGEREPSTVPAEAFVETVLEKSVVIKFSQGFMPKPIPLATIWDWAENHGADVRPET
ncbi:hypothetical protein EXIGLDRAFT_833982 [Exidia glandulosa HHB12029]|uniref:Uncharacterized protein n=1 Tax=Exidia glandulosa HHB12029 TaxID=1314781 RepID=A0A165K7Z6_EXIGL|nr:hypothetical protein EXIGLDRAFT_833982 [Exidia glandulosa HHB12029]